MRWSACADPKSFHDSKEKSMDFPSSLTPNQRKAVHDIAEEMHFEHVSSGKVSLLDARTYNHLHYSLLELYFKIANCK